MLTISSFTLLLSLTAAAAAAGSDLAGLPRLLVYAGLSLIIVALILVGMFAADANRKASEERALRARSHRQQPRHISIR